MKKILSLGTLATLSAMPIALVACGNENHEKKKQLNKEDTSKNENNGLERSEPNSPQYKNIAVGVKLAELSPVDLSIVYKVLYISDEVKDDIENKRGSWSYQTLHPDSYDILLDVGRKVLIAHYFNQEMPNSTDNEPQVYEDWKNSSLRDKISVYHDPHYRSNHSYDDPKNPDDYKLTWT